MPTLLPSTIKKQATLKREGKSDIKPSSVEVLQKSDGPVVVYLFPRSKEITAQDKRVELNTKTRRLQFTQAFFLDEMTYQGKPAL